MSFQKKNSNVSKDDAEGPASIKDEMSKDTIDETKSSPTDT